ncbi:sensor histidine kinase [Geodermatophilus sp. CPCC 205761]|uniref:sensor histidine kinase n=1 Tax=Geodermatophilus sp. CPCC 205761 TaxID=2936597 RepID=UPI003EEA787E
MSTSTTPIAAPSRARRPWSGTRGDAVLAVAMAVVSVGLVLAMPAGPPYEPTDAVTLVVAAAGPLALIWRQTAPLVAQAGASLAIVATAAAGSPIDFLAWPAWFALFSCFVVGGRRLRAAATALAALGVAGYVAFDHGDPVSALPSIMVSFLVATLAGALASRQTRAVAAEAAHAAESRRQALEAERLLAQERGRLARELHDSLGHTVNVMVLQAGVGRRVFADNPAYAHEALGSIETAGRAALDELNRLLRVLQPDRGGTAEPFAPTLADLEEMAERIRATGRQVELRTNEVEVPAGAARAVYRIAQEALTNAVRHTPSGRIRIELRRSGSQLLLEVLNECPPLPAPVPGHGLVNMRERARLEGGELEAAPVDGGFRVRAVLPVGAAVAP